MRRTNLVHLKIDNPHVRWNTIMPISSIEICSRDYKAGYNLSLTGTCLASLSDSLGSPVPYEEVTHCDVSISQYATADKSTGIPDDWFTV